MRLFIGLIIYSFILTFFCCSNSNDGQIIEDENRVPNCEELELVELESTGSSNSIGIGDTINAVVHNTCRSCQIQSVYTGLIAYSNSDTLAVDIELSAQWTPANGESREYELKVLKDFNLGDITRIEMYGVCNSISINL